MNKKYTFSALILYLNYFIHGIGCSILGQQVVKEMLALQWGLTLADTGKVTAVAAALGLGRLISLPVAGPLSDKLGRRISAVIGAASYAIFFVGIAFSPSMTVAYIAAILGGLANSFLDTAIYPAVGEIFYDYTGIATMGIKFFISISQLLMPFFLGIFAGSVMSYGTLALVCAVVIAVLGLCILFAPLPAVSESGKKQSFLQSIKTANFSVESIVLIVIGFTSTATFQLWLNCAQSFGKEVAGMGAEVSHMQTYYSAGTMAALIITSFLTTKIKQIRFIAVYPAIAAVSMLLVYLIRTPFICFFGAFMVGFFAAGGVLQLVTATVNELFPKIKGTITSIVMIASSLSNYTILSIAGNMSPSAVLLMNLILTGIGVLLALFVNMRYGKMVKAAKAEE